MILKKHKAVIAALITAAMTAAAVMPATVSAAGTRNKPEAFGDDTYARRFLSLYDDVVTNGVENGYLSGNNIAPGGFGVPYHCVEELCVEAPDYGHETTSEAMSYIVWMAAMRDNIVNKTGEGGTVGDLAKAWKTLEVMIPTVQTGMMTQEKPSATLSLEWEEPEKYNDEGAKMFDGNTGINPIHPYFTKAYGGDSGLYLMHWLADVDDWYGYGGGSGKFTFINTFQRGANESCFETVPHPSVEELKYGNPQKGIKGVFKTSSEQVPAQWAYTNAPDAEDRAIQAVYAANRWGVGDANVSKLAGKMGDQLRNNMFDKYYKTIGCTDYNEKQADLNDPKNMYKGAHYLMSWYTSWGGAMDGSWTWQIGASHCHEFYQNPLAAFALLQDKDLKAGMMATDAAKDYETSLQRQMEYYLWLQSANGPIAGGSTSSWNGRYEVPEYKGAEVSHFGSSTPSTFYKMSYVEHPVYLDPGSNHWIGNQVWAVQRLAEMYYVIKTEGDSTGVTAGGLSLEEALKTILDRWVDWFLNSEDKVMLYEDGETYDIPSSLDWEGQPADWNGTYSATANSKLTCKATGRTESDLGCISSLCNTLIYYAKAEGAKAEAATVSNNTDLAGQALYTAHELLDRIWEKGRDDIGLTVVEHNGSLRRIFEEEVYVPEYYSGTMPSGQGEIHNGVKFLDFRQKYLEVDKVQELKAALESEEESTEGVDLTYHRFWHAGDIMLALGSMYELYPEVVPGASSTPVTPPTTEEEEKEIVVTPGKVEIEVGETEKLEVTVDGKPADAEFESSKDSVVTVTPDGTVTGVGEGSASIIITVGNDDKVINVVVKPSSSATENTEPETKPTTQAETKDPNSEVHWGDANVDNKVNVADVVAVNLYLLNADEYKLGNGTKESESQGYANADVLNDGDVNTADSSLLMNYVAEIIDYSELGKK